MQIDYSLFKNSLLNSSIYLFFFVGSSSVGGRSKNKYHSLKTNNSNMYTSFFDAFNGKNKICLRFYIALFVTSMHRWGNNITMFIILYIGLENKMF